MRYDSDLLYRPPGEWKSYLLQCTIGCSNNKCTFCGMYKEKKFRIRPTEEILEDIDMAREYYGPNLRRVFLMDGDAIIIKTEEMLKILHKLYAAIPKLEKVTVYAGPRSTLSKTPEELKASTMPACPGPIWAWRVAATPFSSPSIRAAPPTRCSGPDSTWSRRVSTCGPLSLWAWLVRTATGKSTFCPPPK